MVLHFLAVLSLGANFVWFFSRDFGVVAPWRAHKEPDARPVIWIGDFNNFDDIIALILVAKDPRFTVELVVVENSFSHMAHGIEQVYNLLEWLGNLDAEVVRGAYHAVEEVALGANGGHPGKWRVEDGHSVPGRFDSQLPNTLDQKSKAWDLEKRNIVGINLYGQYISELWRDNASTLYGTHHLIPRATQESYRYRGNRGVSFDFKLAEDIILEKLSQLQGGATLLNTGKLTTLARTLLKGDDEQLASLKEVFIMGGGFAGEPPFTADHKAACYGDRSLNLGGNIFTHPSFGCATDFSTHQEFNIFLDPMSAQWALATLAKKGIKTHLIPTNATDLAKVQARTIKDLGAPGGTPESCYTSLLLQAIHASQGGDRDGRGDFALNNFIHLWDIVAALMLLEPDLKGEVRESYVQVDQLDPGLGKSSTPYDPITFDPRVGKTVLSERGAGKKLEVILSIDGSGARRAMIERLRLQENRARKGTNQLECK